ncbi:Creatinase/aminopeptidase [Cristinia sonorae]|uniref:Creatinase/aminopeptidase n=1 Tax=Cristinia sonorae TaxID=1940300 RepID=A0A8K0XR67_9AGAR|nr:Creatinase/aminopeptidase [Cristinia sonorae]
MFVELGRAASAFFKFSPIPPRRAWTQLIRYSSAMAPVNTTDRLKVLRDLMAKPEYDVSAIVIPTDDQHASEYIAQCDERRAFISGFTGSAGTAVVTLKDAYLFTDGRYHLQASQQLDQNWTLMKQGLPDVPTWQEFLSKNLENKSRIGIDPTTFIASDADGLQTSLKPKDSALVSLSDNLVDLVWPERPPRPANKVFPLDVKYAGQSSEDKIAAIRKELKEKNYKAIVISMLDEVAWVLNLRGSDIDYNPVFFAYVIVTDTRTILFVNPAQVDDAVSASLDTAVELQPYNAFFPYLKGIAVELAFTKETKVLLSDKTSLAVAEAIGRDYVTIARSPVADLKSIKNATEIEGFRQSHIRDGSALVRYFAWLDEQLNNGAVLNESQAADQLEKYRSELDLFKGLSFPTISSTGPNGAIIHYQPDPNDCAIVKRDQIYLCDSGAQFLDGTTDTTRTWHFGTPTAEEKRAFTRVLQGHIAIDVAIVPNGTTGYIIDSFARRPLWEDGLDYRHGTGHGVGHFLNVHEGPQGIGMRIVYNSSPLKAGMTVSNEPGYYADGQYGIRIENVVIVRDVQTRNNFGNKGYLGFEHVTMCPIDKKLVDADLLTMSERKWLDAYHAEVLEKLTPHLGHDQKALEWLKKQCSPL